MADHIPLDTTKPAGRDLKATRDMLLSAVVRIQEQRDVLTAMKDGDDYTGLVAAGIGSTVAQASNAYYQLDVLAGAFATPPLKDQLDQFISYLGGN